MTENIQNDENQTFDAQVSDRTAEIAEDDETFDINQDIEQNEGYESVCRE